MMSNATQGHEPAGGELTGHDPSELGELERSVLQLMWQHGTLSADQVREELDLQDRPLKDSTVRTVLRRLEEKGYLTHILDNRTFLYSPAEPAPIVAGRAVKRILEWFCEGSVEQLLVGMVDSSVLDRKELKRLAERIAAAQSASKSAQHAGATVEKANGKGEK
jgi:BlaI family transcriptional regulator, penicillinase repressor